MSNPYAKRCKFTDAWLQERANGAIGKPLSACETESICAELLEHRKALREVTICGKEAEYVNAVRKKKD